MQTTVVHNSTKSVEMDAAVSVIDEEDGVTIREIVDGVNDTAITIDTDEGVKNVIEALEDTIEDEPTFMIGDEVKWYYPSTDVWKRYTISGVDGDKINFDRENGLDVWCYYDQAKAEYENGNLKFIDG